MADTVYQPGDKVLVISEQREAVVERQMPEADDYEVTLANASDEEVATRYVGAGALTLIKAAKASSKASASTEDQPPTA